ncbi:MAG: hypothetical protein ACRD96_24590, partial [Bryobacteraceae bacterium]
PPTPTLEITNAASLRPGLSPQSMGTAKGASLATTTLEWPTPDWPANVGGTTVVVRDSAGVNHSATMSYVSPGQVNFVVPVGVRTGTATVTVTSGDGRVSTGTTSIETVAPALFGVGPGIAAAAAIKVDEMGAQIPLAVFDFAPGTFDLVALPLIFDPARERLFLTLYGTGIRFRSALSAVSVTIGGQNSEVGYAGAQSLYQGFDQVNVEVGRALSGRGRVDVVLFVEGKASNTVVVNIGGPR